mmetsp:Transcript_7936/g.14763  ORF Transcript_7936/g.14763 Transcript_7936/m.14763 type:complete len:224 (+) Transcript_7936:316-987(+)
MEKWAAGPARLDFHFWAALAGLGIGAVHSLGEGSRRSESTWDPDILETGRFGKAAVTALLTRRCALGTLPGSGLAEGPGLLAVGVSEGAGRRQRSVGEDGIQVRNVPQVLQRLGQRPGGRPPAGGQRGGWHAASQTGRRVDVTHTAANAEGATDASHSGHSKGLDALAPQSSASWQLKELACVFVSQCSLVKSAAKGAGWQLKEFVNVFLDCCCLSLKEIGGR